MGDISSLFSVPIRSLKKLLLEDENSIINKVHLINISETLNLEKNESSFKMPIDYSHIHKDQISWYLKKLTQPVNKHCAKETL